MINGNNWIKTEPHNLKNALNINTVVLFSDQNIAICELTSKLPRPNRTIAINKTTIGNWVVSKKKSNRFFIVPPQYL